MNVIVTPPSAMIIAFVPRRRRSVVGIAIRSEFLLRPSSDVMIVPANSYHALPDGEA